MTPFITGALAGVMVMAGLAGVAFFIIRQSRKSASGATTKVRLLAHQYRTMTDSADRDLPVDVLGQPDLIASRMEFRKIDAIESELTGDADRGIAQKLLREFFLQDDPWVKARAAKALYRFDPKLAVGELRSMAKHDSPFVQLPGVWALGELESDRALEILMSMVWNKNPEIQQAVIRSLVQKEIKQQVPREYRQKVNDLLREVRYKTEWIL